MALILIVDDELEAQEMFQLGLSKHGHDVLVAASGDEGVKLARNRQPDLILLDVMMPGISGIDTCKQLRSSEKTGHIPVVLITAYDPAVGRGEALMAGAADYITKPIKIRDLVERVRIVLGQEKESRIDDQRLIREAVHGALAIVPCNLAWLLTLDAQQRALISQVIATSKGEAGVEIFTQYLERDGEDIAIPLRQSESLLVQVALNGAAIFNLPLSKLREAGDRGVYQGCSQLDLYFVSIMPLQMAGTPLGVLLLGSREPRDVETTHGQQLLAAVASQAATAIHNNRLMRRLAEREAEIAQEHAFRQALLDTMSDGLVVYDAQGRINFANHRLSRLTGHDPEAFHGQQIEELFAPEDRERLRPWVHDSSTTNTRSFEVELLRADGASLSVLAVQAGQSVSSQSNGNDRVMVITDLSKQKAREHELTRHANRLSALNRATQAISSALSLDQTISAILGEASNVLQAAIASVLLRVPGMEELAYHASVGPHAEMIYGVRVPLYEGLMGKATQGAQAVQMTDVRNSAHHPHIIEQITGMPVRSAAVAPLTVDGHIVGMIEIVHSVNDAFDRFDLETLEGLAHAAATAIGNARLFGEAKRHVRELTLLLKTAETASSTLAIEQVVEMVVLQLLDALSVKWCQVSSWDRQENQLVHLAEVADMVWPVNQGRVIDLGPYPGTARVLESGQPSVLKPEAADTGLTHFSDVATFQISSLLLLPIVLDGEPVGLAEVCHMMGEHRFTAEDVERCRTAVLAWGKTLSMARAWHNPVDLHRLSARLLRTTGAARCTVYAYERAAKRVILLHQSGKIIWPVEKGPAYALGEGDLRRMALAERTPVLAGLADTATFSAGQTVFPGVEAGSLLLVPLIARGEAIGLVEMLDINPARQFSESDLSLARAIGNVIGNALENGRLYSVLQRRAAQLEAAYNDLKEADRMKEEWIQNVSHELRTPLTSIIGYIELMLQEDFGPLTGELREGLTVIGNKSRQLSQLVENILTLQRTAQEALDLTLVSLNDIARASIQALKPLADQAGVELIARLDNNLPEIYVDAQRILRVFDNLIGNAIKFSPGGGHVNVVTEDIGPAIKIQVSDQGIGIPEEEHEKIWRRFYQVDGSTTRQYGGTGLGLPIAKQIIEKHDGHIWVESTQGVGSTFIFVLPKLERAKMLEDVGDIVD